MQNRKLDVTVGIYDTQITLICHRDGTVTVRTPFIAWDDNTGYLKHYDLYIDNNDNATFVKNLFNNRGFYQGTRLNEYLNYLPYSGLTSPLFELTRLRDADDGAQFTDDYQN